MSTILKPSTLRIAAMLISLGLLAACGRNGQQAPQASQKPTVTVEKPTAARVAHTVTFAGTIQALETAEVRARVGGTLEQVVFEPGQRVQAGDVLFHIEAEPYRIALQKAEGTLADIEARLKLAESTLKRKEQAFTRHAISELDLAAARADVGRLTGQLKQASAAVDDARRNLSYTTVRAPISGRVGRNLVDRGNLVGMDGRTLLTTLVRDDRVYVYFHLNERELNGDTSLKNLKGALVRLGLAGGSDFPFEGKLDFVDNRLDTGTGTIEVRAVFDNPEHTLIPGQYARVQLETGVNEQALLVPEAAVGFDQRGRYVLAVNEQDTVQYLQVAVGVKAGTSLEILDGITPDSRVIVAGIQKVRPGMAVTPLIAGGNPEAHAAR